MLSTPLKKWALTAAVIYAIAKGQKADQNAREELVDATMKEAIERVKKAQGQARRSEFEAADKLLRSYEKQNAPGVKRWRERLEEWRVTEGD